jgi:hypothetical protein
MEVLAHRSVIKTAMSDFARIQIDKDIENQLIDNGWTPPPEKKVFEGDVKLGDINGPVLYVTFGEIGAYLDNRDILGEFVGKRVRVTVEELRNGGGQ